MLSLEASGAAGSKAFFGKDEDRNFDRAVIYWDDMDSSAVQELVAEKLNYKIQPPGLESNLECLSPSRWKGYGSLDWLESFGIGPEMSRGVLIVSSKMITENFISALEASREEILKLQSGAHG